MDTNLEVLELIEVRRKQMVLALRGINYDCDCDCDDDGDCDGCDIPGYHGVHVPWRSEAPPNGHFGIEIEMYADRRREICDYANRLGFIGETDSSLDHCHGIEIIGYPMTYEQTVCQQSPWRKLLRYARQHSCCGHNAGTRYGMHISVCVKDESRLRVCRAIAAFNAMIELGECISMRRNGSYNNFLEYSIDRKKGCRVSRTIGDGCGSAVRYRDTGRLEVRMFRSSLMFSRLIERLQYIRSVLDYADQFPLIYSGDEEGATGHYLAWLRKNSHKYPAITSFLVAKGWVEPERKLVGRKVLCLSGKSECGQHTYGGA